MLLVQLQSEPTISGMFNFNMTMDHFVRSQNIEVVKQENGLWMIHVPAHMLAELVVAVYSQEPYPYIMHVTPA
jgi:hypothetical protein